MRVRRTAAQIISCFQLVRAHVHWHICTHLHCYSLFGIEIKRVSRVIFILHWRELRNEMPVAVKQLEGRVVFAHMLIGVRLKRAAEGARQRHRRIGIELLVDLEIIHYLMDRSQACRKKYCFCSKMLCGSDGKQGDENDVLAGMLETLSMTSEQRLRAEVMAPDLWASVEVVLLRTPDEREVPSVEGIRSHSSDGKMKSDSTNSASGGQTRSCHRGFRMSRTNV